MDSNQARSEEGGLPQFGSRVRNLADKLDNLETFLRRRLDELSMEINATSQLVGMAEDGMKDHFSDIFGLLNAISYHGAGDTPANTGVELDAIVEITERAANRILDAADRIADKLNLVHDSSKNDNEKGILEEMNDDIQEILMACTFQDLTGQRVRKTIENLKMVEDRLGNTLHRLGIDVDEKVVKEEMVKPAAASQDDIDALFNE